MSAVSGDDLVKTPGESVIFTHDFGPILISGETLASGASVTIDPSGDLAAASVGINGSIVTDKNDSTKIVAANEGVSATYSGGTAGQSYTATAAATTSTGEIREVVATVYVRAK